MIVKVYAARNLLLEAKKKLGLDDVHVSGAAAFRLAQALDAWGLAMAEAALAALGEDNKDRRRLRLADLRRLTDRHVEEALNGED